MLPTVLRRIYRPAIMRTGMLHILLDSILRRLTIKQVVRRLNFALLPLRCDYPLLNFSDLLFFLFIHMLMKMIVLQQQHLHSRRPKWHRVKM